MAVHSLDSCLPETEGDARPWQYTIRTAVPETEDDARPWQYTVWTAVCLRLRVYLLVYWGLTPQQQSGSYQGGEMMMMKSVFWWRKPEYPEETTDLRQVTDETFHTSGLCPARGLNLGRSGVKQSELRRDESEGDARPW